MSNLIISSSCAVYQCEVGSAHKCKTCLKNVHLICGTPDESSEEGFGQVVTCFNCKSKNEGRPSFYRFCVQRDYWEFFFRY